MHKCDRCKYKGEHQEMGFRPVGVCLMEHNLVKAVLAYNAPKCPFLKEDIHISQKLGKLQSTISQLSKALCGKENSTLDEILQAANQVKSRLAQVERERDAAVNDLNNSEPCFACYHFRRNKGTCKGGRRCCDEKFKASIGLDEYDGTEWKWRGVCEGENAQSELQQ